MQTSRNIMMVRPASFGFNSETAESNSFQNKPKEYNSESIKLKAIQEFDNAVAIIRSKGINVLTIDDNELPQKPDAIFPNNWGSYHPDGTVILYPMCAPIRRLERRPEILNEINKHFHIENIIDLSSNESNNIFLEGTGSIIFDHINKIAYACLSDRTDKNLFTKTCISIKYKPVSFYSYDTNDKEVYHTNVMMCIAQKFAVICLDSIKDISEREMVSQQLISTGHEIIDINYEQMAQFAGNMLSIQSKYGNEFLAMSNSAYLSLSEGQKKAIEKYNEILPLKVDTIEKIGGGSVRCMIAEIFLPARQSCT